MQNLLYGSYLDQNSSYRSYMEDDSENRFLHFGLFDGHGGFYVAKKLKEIIPIYFEEHFQKEKIIDPSQMNSKLTECFNKIDENFKDDQQAVECGSTGIVGFLYPNPKINNQLLLSIANIGDSSAYLFDSKIGFRLTYEHKASDKREKDRIEKCSGQIFFDRVQGILAITRAFGDYSLKNYGIKSDPFLWPEPIQIKEQYQFLVIASDGIWDAYNNQQKLALMANQLQEMKNKCDCDEMAKYFLNDAKKCGSRDNLSIIVIKLSQMNEKKL